MNWARFFMVVSLLLLVGALAAYFIVEGFQNRLTMAEAQSRMGPSSATVCKAQTKCGDCLDTTKHPGYKGL